MKKILYFIRYGSSYLINSRFEVGDIQNAISFDTEGEANQWLDNASKKGGNNVYYFEVVEIVTYNLK